MIRLQSDTKSILNNKAKIFDIMINKLDLLNPLEILKKGYSVVSIKDKVINSTEGLKKGDIVDIKMSSGTLEAIVNKIKEN